MHIALLAFAVVFPTLCIWLAVRVINRRERWAKRALIYSLIAPPLYVASFGPACWLCERHVLPQRAAWVIFRPLTWLCVHGSEFTSTCLRRYAILCDDHPRIRTLQRASSPGKWIKRYPHSVSPIDFEFDYADYLRHILEGTATEPPSDLKQY